MYIEVENKFICQTLRQVLLLLSIICAPVCNDAVAEAPASTVKLAHKLLSISVSSGENASLSVRVATKDGSSFPEEPKVFSIENPARLVIDIPGVIADSARSLGLNSKVASSIRLGQHPDKTRLVLDLTGETPPHYSSSVNDDGSVLSITSSYSSDYVDNKQSESSEEASTEVGAVKDMPEKPGLAAVSRKDAEKEARDDSATDVTKPSNSARSAKATEKLVKASVVKANVKEEASHSLSQTSAQEEDTEESKEPELVSKAALTSNTYPSDNGKQVDIQGIYFRKDAQGPALLVEVPGLKSYELRKKTDTQFELVLKGTRLSNNKLTHPQFPPEGYEGFELVLARNLGQDSIVKVFVAEGYKLIGYRVDEKLWLKAGR